MGFEQRESDTHRRALAGCINSLRKRRGTEKILSRFSQVVDIFWGQWSPPPLGTSGEDGNCSPPRLGGLAKRKENWCLEQGLVDFIQGQVAIVLGLMGHGISVTTSQPCHCSCRQYANEWARSVPVNRYLQTLAVGGVWLMGGGLPTPAWRRLGISLGVRLGGRWEGKSDGVLGAHCYCKLSNGDSPHPLCVSSSTPRRPLLQRLQVPCCSGWWSSSGGEAGRT